MTAPCGMLGLMDEDDRFDDVMSIQSMLDDDLEIIRRYGDEHPGTWAGLWFENEPAVCIVATFTGDLAQHEAALRSRLRYPTRLVVRQNRGPTHTLTAPLVEVTVVPRVEPGQ